MEENEGKITIGVQNRGNNAIVPYHFIVHSFRCESCHGQAERLLDSAREMEDSIAVNLRSVHCHQLSSRDAACSLFR